MLGIRALTKNKKLPFIAGLIVAVVTLMGSATLTVHKVSADCANDIICAGFSNPSDFISKVRHNNDSGHQDLQAIYSHQFVDGQNLPSNLYDKFANQAVPGLAYRDGTIKVNGPKGPNTVTVATGTKSIGRLKSFQGSDPFSVSFGGNTYWGNTNDKAFASTSPALPVYVLFDSQGTMQFAVLKSCGNPIFGPPTKTSASCNSLQKNAVNGQLNTYDFTASTNVQGNATIQKYIYDFGDGNSRVITSNFGQSVRHTYTRAGNFTAKVTQIVSVPGNNALELPVISMCTKQITVTLPYCIGLTGVIIDKTKFIAQFTVTAKVVTGSHLVSADFTFGDNKSQNGVHPTTPTTVVVTHPYPGGGKTFHATATLHFATGIGNQTITAPVCQAKVTPQTIVSECKPNVPVGSPECAPPCKTDNSLPADSPKCGVVVPATLPNTGAGNTIALFAAVVVGGFLVYRQILYRRHKAAFLAAESGASILPLGDPLNDEAPLADTPLAPKRKSFRRRQF